MTLSKRMLRRPWCADPGCDHRAIAQAGICAARENAEHLVVKRARLLHAALRLRRVGDTEQLASGRHADAELMLLAERHRPVGGLGRLVELGSVAVPAAWPRVARQCR